MKFLVILTVAVSLFCFAAAVTNTAYSDSNCKTVAPAVGGIPNPQVIPSNTCYSADAASSSIKYTSCGGGKAVMSSYSDKSCTNFITTITLNTDVCASDSGKSAMITCAPASSVNVALAAVAAAAVLLFVQ